MFKLIHTSVHLLTIDIVSTVKLILFIEKHGENGTQKYCDTLIPKSIYVIWSYHLLNIKILSLILRCRMDDDDGYSGYTISERRKWGHSCVVIQLEIITCLLYIQS